MHSPCSRLYIAAAVAINTTVSGVIRTWILSYCSQSLLFVDCSESFSTFNDTATSTTTVHSTFCAIATVGPALVSAATSWYVNDFQHCLPSAGSRV